MCTWILVVLWNLWQRSRIFLKDKCICQMILWVLSSSGLNGCLLNSDWMCVLTWWDLSGPIVHRFDSGPVQNKYYCKFTIIIVNDITN